jgi:hypothetical protein
VFWKCKKIPDIDLSRNTAAFLLYFLKKKDLSTVPSGIQTIQINYDDHAGLVRAFSGVDVVL